MPVDIVMPQKKPSKDKELLGAIGSGLGAIIGSIIPGPGTALGATLGSAITGAGIGNSAGSLVGGLSDAKNNKKQAQGIGMSGNTAIQRRMQSQQPDPLSFAGDAMGLAGSIYGASQKAPEVSAPPAPSYGDAMSRYRLTPKPLSFYGG